MRKITKKIFSGLNERNIISSSGDENRNETQEINKNILPIPRNSSPAVLALTQESENDGSPAASIRPLPGAAAITKVSPININAKLPSLYPRFLPNELPLETHLQLVKIASFGTSVDADNKPYTVYCLEVRSTMSMPSSWTVYRRFNQFCRLRQTLQELENIKLPELPPRIQEYSIEQTISQKRQLEIWLYSLIELHLSTPGMEPLILNEQVRKFLTENFNAVPEMFTHRYASPRRVPSDMSLLNTPASPGGSKVSIHDFNVVTTIGKGAFGQVFLVKNKKDPTKIYAMKSIRRRDIVHERQYAIIDRERRIMGQLHCPFIVEMHFVLKTKESLFFVLDYCAGGELLFHLSRMGRFPERMARFYCAELCLALAYLHDRDIVYRDLKPENILLNAQGHVKLVDFGLARSNVPSYTEGAKTYCGTEQYLAPEVLDRCEYGKAIDWWALGMILYEMLTGLPPWYNDNRQELFAGIRYGVLKFPRNVSRLSALFTQALLIRDPRQRLGSNGSSEVKEHPFFHEVDWIDLAELQVTPPMLPCATQQDAQTATNFEDEFKSMPVNSFCDWDELEDVPDHVDFSCAETFVSEPTSRRNSYSKSPMAKVQESEEEQEENNNDVARPSDIEATFLTKSQSNDFQGDHVEHDILVASKPQENHEPISSHPFTERHIFVPPSPFVFDASSSSTPSNATTVPAFSSSCDSSCSAVSYAPSVTATLAPTPLASRMKQYVPSTQSQVPEKLVPVTNFSSASANDKTHINNHFSNDEVCDSDKEDDLSNDGDNLIAAQRLSSASGTITITSITAQVSAIVISANLEANQNINNSDNNCNYSNANEDEVSFKVSAVASDDLLLSNNNKKVPKANAFPISRQAFQNTFRQLLRLT